MLQIRHIMGSFDLGIKIICQNFSSQKMLYLVKWNRAKKQWIL